MYAKVAFHLFSAYLKSREVMCLLEILLTLTRYFCSLEKDRVLQDCIFLGKFGELCGGVQRHRYLNFNRSQLHVTNK